MQTGLQLVSGVIDAIAILAPQKPVDASTPLLESPLAGAALSIEAPFVNLDASGALFPSQITIQPRHLAAQEIHFQLSAPAQSCEPGPLRRVRDRHAGGARLPAAGQVDTRPAARAMSEDPRVGGDELSARVGELRRLTIMFCDVVGSTELSGRLEPETYRELMRGTARRAGT